MHSERSKQCDRIEDSYKYSQDYIVENGISFYEKL